MALTGQKIVATQLKGNILVAFNATRTKVWKQEGEVVSIQIQLLWSAASIGSGDREKGASDIVLRRPRR